MRVEPCETPNRGAFTDQSRTVLTPMTPFRRASALATQGASAGAAARRLAWTRQRSSRPGPAFTSGRASRRRSPAVSLCADGREGDTVWAAGVTRRLAAGESRVSPDECRDTCIAAIAVLRSAVVNALEFVPGQRRWKRDLCD